MTIRTLNHIVRSAVTYVPPVLVGVAMVLLGRTVYAAPEDTRTTLVWACFGTVVALTFAASTLIASRVRRPLGAAHVAFTPTLFTLFAFGTFILVGTESARVAIALLVMSLIAAHAAFVAGMEGLLPRYHESDLKHLSAAIRVITAFFAYYCAFRFTTSSEPFGAVLRLMQLTAAAPVVTSSFAALLSAGASAYIAWETLRDEKFSHVPPILVSLSFGLLAFESHLALSFLPVTALTSAATLLILFAGALVAVVLVLRGAKIPKRNVLLVAALVSLVMLTARWQ